MNKLIMCYGLPASGKSQWALEYIKAHPNTVRINDDDRRLSMFGDSFDFKKHETLITATREGLIYDAMAAGFDVIVDNTNLHPKHEKRYEEMVVTNNRSLIAKQYEFVKEIFDTSVQECVKRDALRAKPVGAKVIYRMYRDYLKPKTVVLEQNKDLPCAIICDIDGTLALFDDKNPYDRDFSQDRVNEPVYLVLNRFLTAGRTLIFCSGRDTKYRKSTIDWIEDVAGYNADYDRFKLFMRPVDDKREDSIVKHELFDTYIKDQYYVEFVLDDRQRVVDMWRSLGLTVFQVADGNF